MLEIRERHTETGDDCLPLRCCATVVEGHHRLSLTFRGVPAVRCTLREAESSKPEPMVRPMLHTSKCNYQRPWPSAQPDIGPLRLRMPDGYRRPDLATTGVRQACAPDTGSARANYTARALTPAPGHSLTISVCDCSPWASSRGKHHSSERYA